MAETALTYCAAQVRREDRERYLTALFAPPERREALFALYAFNLEIAKTAEVVSEPLLGQVRLAWWRETIGEIFAGRARQHALSAPLAEAIARHELPRGHFERLVEAREFDLDDEPPADMAGLERYAEESSATLVFLALRVLGVAEEGPAREAARRLGLTWALTGLARAVPFHARQRRLYLPADLTRAAGLDPEAVFALRSSPALSAVVEDLAARAGAHLAAARAERARLPGAALPAMLLAPLAERHLGVLRRAGHDPFDVRVQAEAPGSVWRLLWARLARRY